MKKLITTIAALALAVASYGQTNITTWKEQFTGTWSGNWYFGCMPSTYDYPGGNGCSTVKSPFFSLGNANDVITINGVNTRIYAARGVSDRIAVNGQFGDMTDALTLTVDNPSNNFEDRSLFWHIREEPWVNANGFNLDITTNPYVTLKVNNMTTFAGVVELGVVDEGNRFGGAAQTQSFTLAPNAVNYLVFNPSGTTNLRGFRIKVKNIVGDVDFDDLRAGFALPTGVTALIEANNSTTVAGGGTLSFAIPSVTGSVEYANEIPFLSVSPSTLGTIDQTGAFTAGSTGGVVTITAASYGVSSIYVVTIPTVYITSSTIVGVTSLATSATSTYSISGITPSNAEAPTSTVWMSSNTAVATINATTGVLTGVSVGTTNVSAKHILSNNTTITSNAIAVNVFTYVTSATVSGAAALTVGGMATYSISGITPSNAQAPTLNVFKSSNTAVATIDGTSGALKAVGAGTTTVYALHTLSNNTVITSAGVTLVVSSVAGPNSISAGLSASDFSVAPNPTTDAVSVSAPVAVSGLKVYSLTGVEVASSSTTSVSLSGASAGVYILEISTANGSVFKRVIKE